MSFQVNKPVVLAQAGVALRTVTINAAPSGPGAALVTNTAAPLTLNDAASIATAATGNLIWSAPLSALTGMVGQTVQLQTPTSNGLTISAVPPGVGITVDLG